jgi:hypothetical protein
VTVLRIGDFLIVVAGCILILGGAAIYVALEYFWHRDGTFNRDVAGFLVAALLVAGLGVLLYEVISRSGSA